MFENFGCKFVFYLYAIEALESKFLADPGIIRP